MVPIEVVPDPVFARKMVGEGFSIDPLSTELLAPIAGEVADLQPSGHAVTIRSDDGLEVLLHIGLDTVKMAGAGFTPRVTVGQRVDAGDPLVDFDMEMVASQAKSLLTQVVIANSEMVQSVTPRKGVVTGGRDVAAEVVLAAAPQDGTPSAAGGRAVTSEALLIPNPTGLHARPAATLANLAKSFSSDVKLRRGDDAANAKSIMAIMALAVARGDKVTFSAHGADADAAIEAITKAVKEGLGEECPPIGTDDTGPVPAVREPESGDFGQPV
ncbi:MAG: HPr family phosphocarrier protein, partial [Austwickia sp.]|nr:HPr family phosphocarrier protein [Austwickia sp.]